jgi:hypothetical protein
MQITIPAEVTHGVVTGSLLTVAGLIGRWMLHTSWEQAKEWMNGMVTANVNRIAKDLSSSLDQKHEENKLALQHHRDEDQRNFDASRKDVAELRSELRQGLRLPHA